ncbi:hypothetical protein HNQ80_000398 [Anaerosolibacter carboniphilus]|uniref:Uncharacterized protein n=1 Tax=Anaerosolibacter carboniphilus TaxID=1417629 RepID=A0A841KVW3_9FIRM|nr:hypothetical protein [Anaerosolibacter carboniphilus]
MIYSCPIYDQWFKGSDIRTKAAVTYGKVLRDGSK